MKRFFIMYLGLAFVLFTKAQNDNDIQITWIDTPLTVNDSHITLRWGIKAKAQITAVDITHNGIAVKGINAVANDGYDMKKSQVLKLEKDENEIGIIVTTVAGSKKDSKVIILLADDENNHHDDIGDYANVDSMIVSAYRGDEKAQYLLGKSYLNGTNGLQKDLFESSLWFKKSAERLFAPSQYEYAVALFEGRGILKNPLSAIDWLIQSANKDYAEAQMKLGLCYEMGEGIDKNIEKAKEMYRKCPLPEAKQRLMVLEKQ